MFIDIVNIRRPYSMHQKKEWRAGKTKGIEQQNYNSMMTYTASADHTVILLSVGTDMGDV